MSMQKLWKELKWLSSTVWPLYAASIFVCNAIGAALVALFLGVLLPIKALAGLSEVPPAIMVALIAYFVLALVSGIATTWAFCLPIIRWQHSPKQHKASTIRTLVIRIPAYQALVGLVIWGFGTVMFTAIAAAHRPRLGVVVGVVSVVGGLMVALLTYLIAERLFRPIARDVLRKYSPESLLEPPLILRLRLTWILTTMLPVLAMVLALVAQDAGYFTPDAADLMPTIVALAVVTMMTGYVGNELATASVVDPVHELQEAINGVRRGDTNTRVAIYDGSEIGVLQAGFNEMMRGLQERQKVRDIFGRYVGAEVASRALEVRPELGGENREVAVLFVDVVSSTEFAVNNPPEVVVAALNEFFERVVDVVHSNRGIINKFQGDAALAVFGAPLDLDDAAGHALAAARELRKELRGLRLDAGIGVAAGNVVAGHLGGHDRFEYTVIGDAVNSASRLTDIAKLTPGGVLTTAETVRMANKEEQARWTALKSVELRGRKEMTQLARPLRSTLAERS